MRPEFWDASNAQQREALLWQHINQLVATEKLLCGLDENAHGKISMWIALGDLPGWRVERLAMLNVWSDTAWMTYYALKESLVQYGDVDLPVSLTPCPVTFADLLFE
jgi:hypothetical protein